MTAADERPRRDDTAGAHCWCGGLVGPQTFGDPGVLGCLRDDRHDWRGVPRRDVEVIDAAELDDVDSSPLAVPSGYLHASQHRSAAQQLAHTAGDALAVLDEFLDTTQAALPPLQRDQLALIRTSLELAQVHATLAGEPR